MPGLGLVIDPIRTNFATNPFAGAGLTTGWTKVGMNTLTAVTFDGKEGRPEPVVLPNGEKITTGFFAETLNSEGTDSIQMPVTFPVGGKYILSAYIFGISTKLVSPILVNPAGTLLGNAPTLPVENEWVRMSTEVPATSEVGTGHIELRERSAGPGVLKFYFTGALLEQATTLGNYFPTPAQLATGAAAFTGEAHASVSQLGEGVPTTVGAVSLNINDGTKFRGISFSAPPPPRRVSWSSSASTEGSKPTNLGYDNRTITYVARVYGSSDADFMEQLDLIEQKIGKINEEGGTLEVVTQSGRTCIFDLLEGEAAYEIDNAALANRRVEVTVTLTAEPFWRDGILNQTAGTDHAETTLPCVTGVDIVPGGDVPAIGRLVIDDDQAQDRWTAVWGVQSRYYDPSPDAALFYEAESREPLGGAAKATLSGSSGSGENAVLQGTLGGSYQAILSTQKAGGGNHLRHVGAYRVFARLFRPSANAGQVSVRLEWGEGDLRRRTLNDEVVYEEGDREGFFTIADLGLVDLKEAVSGAQRWEGRVVAKSTVATDDLYVDCLMIVPVDEGYGASKVTPSAESPTSFKAREEFDQSAGNLDEPKALPIGGNWVEASKTGANGFTIDTGSHRAKRQLANDTELDNGVFAVANGVTAYGAQVVQADFSIHLFASGPLLWPNIATQDGVLVRYASTENFAKATYEPETRRLKFTKRVAKGKYETLAAVDVGLIALDTAYTIRCMVDAGGRFFVWMALAGTSLGLPTLIGQDPDLATGGALATGKPGIYDSCFKGTVPEWIQRYFDNFAAWVPQSDAAVFASQSMEVWHDRVLREDSAGTVAVKPTNYKGSYFRPPPARMEGRSVRSLVFLSRNNIDTMADTAIDDASFRIYWQGRGLMFPEG